MTTTCISRHLHQVAAVAQCLLLSGAVALAESVSGAVDADSSGTEGDRGGQPVFNAELQQLHALLDSRLAGGEAFEYWADSSFVNYVQGDSILLRGHVIIEHRGTRLEAGEMVYHRSDQVVEARAFVDSSGPLGKPLLTLGDDVLRGEVILYDVSSGNGTILQGRIQYKDSFYSGRHIETLSDERFHIHAGFYTTCDLPHPHFDFYSPRIKVLVGDMAIARPVYFRIGKTRLFWVPFYVFSLREDRQSGLLTPGYGRRPLSFGSRESEWEVRDLGYYFAPSDYWDVRLSTALRGRSGWLARLALRYALRYNFRGGIETRLENRTNSSQWWTTFNHDQELGQSASLRFSGTFQSNSNFIRDNSSVLEERLSRTLRSNLRFNKRWREAGYSFSFNASQTKNLDAGTFNEVLPEISLRSNRKSLFGGRNSQRGSSQPWYSRVYYDFNGRVRNTRRGTSADTTSVTSGDVGLRLSSQQRPAPWFNVNASLDERWRDSDLRRGSAGFEGVRTDRATLSGTLSQTVYGMFFPNIGPVTALRHVLKPDLGLRYQATRTDSGDALGIGGGDTTPWRQSRQVTFRMSNTFWVKVLRDEEESKVRLAQLNMSTSYDFDRNERKLSDLTSTLTAEAGRRFNTRLTLRSEFYDDDDDFHLSPRLRQFEVNSTLQAFTQRRPVRTSAAGSSRSEGAGVYGSAGPGGGSSYRSNSSAYGGDYGYENGLQRDVQRRRRQLQLSHYFSRRTNASSTTTHSWLRLGAGGTWRRAWHLQYSINYNLKREGVHLIDSDRVTAELLSVQREFHDWTATLNIEPSSFGRDRAFYFKAQFKDIPQIRLERGDRSRL